MNWQRLSKPTKPGAQAQPCTASSRAEAARREEVLGKARRVLGKREVGGEGGGKGGGGRGECLRGRGSGEWRREGGEDRGGARKEGGRRR